MGSLVASILSAFPPPLRRALTLRFDKSPVDTFDALVEFVHTRSAYIAQTSLYGYLKTRMGTRYPSMFEDEVFSVSISTARWHTFAACLSDLTVFATALCAQARGLDDEQAAALARACLESAVRQTFDDAPGALSGLAGETVGAFGERAGATVWSAAAQGEAAFTRSPVALIKWAPIADELKQFDEEIVTNSIRFRWRDVREQLRKRLDGKAVYADWLTHQSA